MSMVRSGRSRRAGEGGRNEGTGDAGQQSGERGGIACGSAGPWRILPAGNRGGRTGLSELVCKVSASIIDF
jgi:hypothetical protein